MKKTFNIMMLFALLVSVAACSKGKDEPIVDLPLEATYTNVAGTWMLTSLNDAPLTEGLYCYIELNRKDRTFVTYDNLGSMYANRLTGTYELGTDKKDSSIDLISGKYDFGWGSWNNVYQVVVYEERMVWSVQGGTEVSVYERCAEIPEDVKNGTVRSVSDQGVQKFL